MTDFSNFLNMGGYAAYVWPAYAVAALGLIGVTVFSIRALHRARRAHARFSGKE